MLPPDLLVVPVRWNQGLNHAGDTVVTSITFTPSQTLIHEASRRTLTSIDWVDTSRGRVDLPAVDQPGVLDEMGNEITDWHYLASITYRSGSQVDRVQKTFQPRSSDQVTGLDLDLVPSNDPVGPPVVVVRGVSSVNGLTGAVTLTAGEVGADAAGSASQALAAAQDYTDAAFDAIPAPPVTSVAGKSGDVTLTAGDVGADAAGSASQALASAKDYTDSKIAAIPAPPVTSVAGKVGDVVLLASDVGLGGVDNTADLDKPVSNSTQIALDLKADLVNGKVPESQLPSFVDDVLEFPSLGDFPAVGESGKVYIASDTNQTYRWDGAGYTRLSEGVALGETSSTAYRGDRGKTAYDHTLLVNNPHNVTKAQVGLGSVENLAPADLPVSTATASALAGKASTEDVVDLKAKTIAVVTHGVNSSTPRPAGVGAVLWRGSVEPVNRAPGDIWAEVN